MCFACKRVFGPVCTLFFVSCGYYFSPFVTLLMYGVFAL